MSDKLNYQKQKNGYSFVIMCLRLKLSCRLISTLTNFKIA